MTTKMQKMTPSLFVQKFVPIRQALGLKDTPDLAEACGNLLKRGYAVAHFVPVFGPGGKQDGILLIAVRDPDLAREIESESQRLRDEDNLSPVVDGSTPEPTNLGTGEVVAPS